MKVTVESDRCMGHGQCYSYASDVYQSDDEGFCVVIRPDVDGDDVKQAVEGAQVCPESAITVRDPESPPILRGNDV